MKTANKIIMSGIAAFLISCSDVSTTPDITGATTEPSSSPKTPLTEEQKAILANSLYTLVDSTKVDSLKAIFGSDVTTINFSYMGYFSTFPRSVKNDQVFSYPSKDGRKVCDVVTYIQENRVNRKGVLRAMSYDVHDRKCRRNNGANICDEDDYMNSHSYETIATAKIVDVEGVPVVVKTIGDNGYDQFWGYGVS